MRKCAQNDGADPAFEIVCDIAKRFPCVQAFMALIDERDRAAEPADAGLEGDASPEGRLFEKHSYVLVRKHSAEFLGAGFHSRGQMHELIDLARRKIADRHKILSGDLIDGRLLDNRRCESLAAQLLAPLNFMRVRFCVSAAVDSASAASKAAIRRSM